jgi:hypothetical protein
MCLSVFLQYVTLDDIMDLVGSDSLHSEEVMRKMWGDSIEAVNCTTPRITYDDFLLLMKGQTRDGELVRDGSQRLASSSQGLMAVPEDGEGDVAMDALPRPMSLTPIKSSGTDDFDLDTPLSMDDDEDLLLAQSPNSAGLAMTNSYGSLTPPTTPRRGPTDFVSPIDVRRKVSTSGMILSPDLEIPGFSTAKPAPLQNRSRSRSVGDDGFDDQEGSESPSSPQSVPPTIALDGQGAIALLEHEPDLKLSDVVDDKGGSVLQVNRQLYRAHRQMRLSVVEASKRFEEQRTRHARDLLQREADGEENPGMRSAPAGLVMRRGIIQPVSSEVIKKFLQKNETEQQVLVEKANKHSGRGRRRRTKTISDMSAMVGSLSQDQLHSISISAATDSPEEPLETVKSVESADEAESVLRGATIPGSFRQVKDPFGAQGKYASQK